MTQEELESLNKMTKEEATLMIAQNELNIFSFNVSPDVDSYRRILEIPEIQSALEYAYEAGKRTTVR